MKGFFGAVETTEAEKLLTPEKKGTYLVRFSSELGCYAITVLTSEHNSNVLKHFRVIHRAGEKYVVGTSSFDSLDDLIKGLKKDLFLKTPLSGSKYETMYIAAEKKIRTDGYREQVHYNDHK